MKICIVSLQYGETVTGGGGVHVNTIVKKFLNCGLDVIVLSIHTIQTVNKARIFYPIGKFRYSVENKLPGLSVVRFLIEEGIEHPYVGPKKREYARIRNFCDVAYLWVKEHRDNFDVIHLHGHHMIVGYLAKQLQSLGIKKISTIHAVESVYESAKLRTGHGEIDEAFIKNLKNLESEYRFADFIVAPSPAVKSEIFEIFHETGVNIETVENKIKIIPSGIEKTFLSEEDIEKMFHPSQIQILMLSRIDPSKGFHFGIDAIRDFVKDTGINVHLAIAGRVSSEKYLNILKSKCGKYSHVFPTKFYINVPESKKMALYDKAHIFMMPTLQDTFGITLVEAGARSCMILTTDTSGPEFVVGGKSRIDFPWGYVSELGIIAKKTSKPNINLHTNLKHALIWIYENWEECIPKIKAFRKKIIANFLWDSVIDSYLKLYKELLKK
jgi:glycosyltransferase involved in cell wall biosynthesis